MSNCEYVFFHVEVFLIDVGLDYNKDEYISVSEATEIFTMNKRYILEAARSAGISVIAKAKSGKKGAPIKLYSKQEMFNAILSQTQTNEMIAEKKAFMALLFGADEKEDNE